MGRPQRERWRRRRRVSRRTVNRGLPVLASVLALALCGGSRAADRPAGEPESIFTAARAAVASGRIEKSQVHGYYDERRGFTEVPADGAVLVGFDCGVGKFGDIETVYALRSIYRTPGGDVSYRAHGSFSNQWLGSRTVKSRVLRTVRIVARPGYAVGAATLRIGMNMNGLGLTFMRIKGRLLDPFQSYRSAWVGDRTGGSEIELDGDGAPAVGVYGCQDEEHVFALGLYFMQLPARAADRPRGEQKPVTRRVEVPKAEQPAEAAKKAEGAGPAAAPGKAPAKEPLPMAQAMSWVPIAVFGCVAVSILAFLVSVGRKGQARDRGNADPTQKPADAVPPDPPASASIRERSDVGHIYAGGDLPDAAPAPPGLWGRTAPPGGPVPPAGGRRSPQGAPAAVQGWAPRGMPGYAPPERAQIPRPWWVETGLKGIHRRGTAWVFFWISVALTFGPGIIGAALGKPYFICGLFAVAAAWYWLCIRWVDEHGKWE